MFLLFGYYRYDAIGGADDIIATAETLEELLGFIENNKDCIRSLDDNFNNLYAYNPITESRYNYENNKFGSGYRLLKSQKVQTYSEELE